MEKSGEREKSVMQERGETSRTLIRRRQEGVDAVQPEWRSLCSGLQGCLFPGVSWMDILLM